MILLVALVIGSAGAYWWFKGSGFLVAPVFLLLLTGWRTLAHDGEKIDWSTSWPWTWALVFFTISIVPWLIKRDRLSGDRQRTAANARALENMGVSFIQNRQEP
jgi:uncharacterized membrane protein YbhN (UPF0104 family)